MEVRIKLQSSQSSIRCSNYHSNQIFSSNVNHFQDTLYFAKEDAGLAAYKSVELDEMLGGCTSQYREVSAFYVRFNSFKALLFTCTRSPSMA